MNMVLGPIPADRVIQRAQSDKLCELQVFAKCTHDSFKLQALLNRFTMDNVLKCLFYAVSEALATPSLGSDSSGMAQGLVHSNCLIKMRCLKPLRSQCAVAVHCQYLGDLVCRVTSGLTFCVSMFNTSKMLLQLLSIANTLCLVGCT